MRHLTDVGYVSVSRDQRDEEIGGGGASYSAVPYLSILSQLLVFWFSVFVFLCFCVFQVPLLVSKGQHEAGRASAVSSR